jgi:hypothetical protein
MTKRQAIKVIERQKRIVNTYWDDLIWRSITLSHFEHFFGNESGEYRMMQSYNVRGIPRRDEITDEQAENIIRGLVKLLDEAIESIRYKGILKPTQSNFLSGQSNGAIVGVLTTIVVAIGGGCYLFGIYTSDVKNYELRQDNTKVKDSLSKARDTLFTYRTNAPDKKPQTDTAKHDKAQK